MSAVNCRWVFVPACSISSIRSHPCTYNWSDLISHRYGGCEWAQKRVLAACTSAHFLRLSSAPLSGPWSRLCRSAAESCVTVYPAGHCSGLGLEGWREAHQCHQLRATAERCFVVGTFLHIFLQLTMANRQKYFATVAIFTRNPFHNLCRLFGRYVEIIGDIGLEFVIEQIFHAMHCTTAHL